MLILLRELTQIVDITFFCIFFYLPESFLLHLTSNLEWPASQHLPYADVFQFLFGVF